MPVPSSSFSDCDPWKDTERDDTDFGEERDRGSVQAGKSPHAKGGRNSVEERDVTRIFAGRPQRRRIRRGREGREEQEERRKREGRRGGEGGGKKRGEERRGGDKRHKREKEKEERRGGDKKHKREKGERRGEKRAKRR
eukprot:scaffold295430_cov28-Tisochrysis_lutea.AAC.1